MPKPARTVIEQRSDQMFPTLEPAEISLLERFGERHSFAEGQALALTGESGHGLILILSGEVDVAQREEAGQARISLHTAPDRSWANWRSCLGALP